MPAETAVAATTVVFDKKKVALAVGLTVGIGVSAGVTYWIIKKRHERKNTVVIINDPAAEPVEK